MNRTVAVLGVLTGLVVAGLTGAWMVLIRPYRQLPRPAPAIEADWAALAPRPPSSAAAPDPSLFAFDDDPTQVPPEAIEALGAAIDAGLHAPVGCTVLRDVEGDALSPSPPQAYHAARALIAHGHPDHAEVLALDLYQGDFLSIALGSALARDLTKSGHPLQAPSPQALRDALVREAACGDALFDLLLSGDLPQDQAPPLSPFFAFRTAHLRYRDRMLQLIAATGSPEPIPALEALPPVDSNALLTRMLAVQPSMVLDVLDPERTDP